VLTARAREFEQPGTGWREGVEGVLERVRKMKHARTVEG